MTLPCQEHDVTRLGGADRPSNGGGTVMKDLEPAAGAWSRGEERGLNGLRDEVRALPARIFIGDPYQVSAGRRSPHICPSTRIALARSSRYQQQAPSGATQLARYGDRRRQRWSRMGEIDDDAERLCAVNQLTSAWRSDLCLNRSDRWREWQAPRSNEGECCSRIRGIDPPRHAEMQLRLHTINQHLVLRVSIVSRHPQPGCLRRVGERLHRWVTGMHHHHERQLARVTRRTPNGSRHELRLGGAILIEVRMEVEMVC
jgi:hypothetical protein